MWVRRSVILSATFKVTEAQVSPDGIFLVNYERDGDVKTGGPQI